jgi:hypothetical protein
MAAAKREPGPDALGLVKASIADAVARLPEAGATARRAVDDALAAVDAIEASLAILAWEEARLIATAKRRVAAEMRAAEAKAKRERDEKKAAIKAVLARRKREDELLSQAEALGLTNEDLPDA